MKLLRSVHPAAGTTMAVESGYWMRIWRCDVETFVPTVREGDWTWRDSARTPGRAATSSAAVPAHRSSTSPPGRSWRSTTRSTRTARAGHAQQTYWFTTCLSASRTVDLTVSGCLLTKP